MSFEAKRPWGGTIFLFVPTYEALTLKGEILLKIFIALKHNATGISSSSWRRQKKSRYCSIS
jgi:hypothetical protein